MNALLFDCDGVLADTERDGHLPAFNAAFAAFGLPLRWSQAEYAHHLRFAGGKERLAAILTPELLQRYGVVDTNRADWIAALHAAKITAFERIVASGRLTGRPGIARIARAMHERGWRLAVVSTSAEESVRAVLALAVGRALAREFAIFAGDVVAAKKPAPDIYTFALDRLGVAACDTIAIEDSRSGLLAATAAGLRCVVTLSSFTESEDMKEAIVVVPSLGEPGEAPIRVVANRGSARIGAYVTPDDLVACIAHEPAQGVGA